MLNCREATELISKSLDRSLSLSERLRVTIHLLVCRACTRYRAHLRFLRRSVREATRLFGTGEFAAGPGLSREARDRIRKAIADVR